MTATELLSIRHKLGLYQDDLAEALGVSIRQYRYYESGTKTVPRLVALAVAGYARQQERNAPGDTDKGTP